MGARFFRGFIAAVAVLLAQSAIAAEIVGRVVGVSDGDTLTVLTGANRQVRVRLAEIDTPESGQPYGSRAKQTLSDLAFGKAVRVDVQDTDRYGRTVGRVYVGSRDVNAEMVRGGAAWVYRQYNRDPALPPIEAEARAARRGLWSLHQAERTPPWEWRVAQRDGRLPTIAATPAPSTPSRTASAGVFSCDAKRKCGEMASCAEARFYLSECRLTRLDVDGDGIPCESLCR